MADASVVCAFEKCGINWGKIIGDHLTPFVVIVPHVYIYIVNCHLLLSIIPVYDLPSPKLGVKTNVSLPFSETILIFVFN